MGKVFESTGKLDLFYKAPFTWAAVSQGGPRGVTVEGNDPMVVRVT